MQNKPYRLGPVAVPSTPTNLLLPGTTTGGINTTGSSTYGFLYVLMYHLRVVNTDTANPHWISLFVGGSTGTVLADTIFWYKTQIPEANNSDGEDNFDDWYGRCRFDQSEYLVMVADAPNVLVIQGEGEIGLY
jgi:hypothetical protein